jgi:hypothetical protein
VRRSVLIVLMFIAVLSAACGTASTSEVADAEIPPAESAATTKRISTATIQPSPNPNETGVNRLRDISCPSVQFCLAVGFTATALGATSSSPFAIAYRDSVWSITSTASTGLDPRSSATLQSVSCASEQFCVAVGSYRTGNSSTDPLAMVWNGETWSLMKTNGSIQGADDLYSVSCVSERFCVSVGYSSRSDFADSALVLVWDGTLWTDVNVPSTGISDVNRLLSVSCTSTTSCMAVGRFRESSLSQTLTLAWDGVRWAIISSPNSDLRQNNVLNSVSCVATNYCIAVGNFDVQDTTTLDWVNNLGGRSLSLDRPLMMKWDGSSWTQLPGPTFGTTRSESLSGVSCVTQTFCATVGEFDSGLYDQTLVFASFDSNWTTISSPNSSPTQSNQLSNISCPSEELCFAVGNYDGASTPQQRGLRGMENSKSLVITMTG